MADLSYGTPEEAGVDPARVALLHERAASWCDGHRMRSGVLLAARRGTIFFHEAFGPLTDKADSPALQKNAVFSVASISKPVTATAIMMLVEDGRLGLNRPVKEYMPELCGEGIDDVEVQHLLTHTSGFTNEDLEVRFNERFADAFKNVSPAAEMEPGQHPLIAAILSCYSDLGARTAPGSRMEYCGYNYTLLGEIVGRVSGQTLDVFARENIFDPLGMSGSTFVFDEARRNRWVQRGEGAFMGAVAGDPVAGGEGTRAQSTPSGGGGLNTTAGDIAAFGQMYLNKGQYGGKRYLSHASVHEMTRNQIPGITAEFLGGSVEASWGLGWMIQANTRWVWSNATLPPVGTFSHGGSGGHCFWVDPVNEIVGVYLSVCNEVDDSGEHHGYQDLFMNMITAAVVD